MGEKKDQCRFTIQFNSKDSKHLQVAEILNQQGRHKAQFLVNMVVGYGNHVKGKTAEPPFQLDYHTIETMVLLKNKKQRETLKCRQEKNLKMSNALLMQTRKN